MWRQAHEVRPQRAAPGGGRGRLGPSRLQRVPARHGSDQDTRGFHAEGLLLLLIIIIMIIMIIIVMIYTHIYTFVYV